MQRIYYDDILFRKIIREINEDKNLQENCDFLSKRLENGNYNDAVRFMRECSSSPLMCNNYMVELRDIKNNYPDDSTVTDIWNKLILPKLSVDVPPLQDEDTVLQITKNKVCDRILDNHDRIQKMYDIKEFASKYHKSNKPEFIMNKICETVDKFKLPQHGKVVIALEEFYYIASMYDISYNNESIGCVPVEYFCHGNVSKTVRESLQKSIAIDYNPYWISDKSGIEYDIFSIKEYCLSGADEKLIESKMNNLIDKVNSILESETLTRSNLLDTIGTITNGVTSMHLYRTNLYGSNISISNNINNYRNRIIKECAQPLEEFADIMYTDYNVKCMNYFITESSTVYTLNEFKLFKFNNIFNNVRKIDKYLGKKINNIKERVLSRIKSQKRKIFSEANIYDMITESGNIDMVITEFEFFSNVDINIHNIMTDICKSINEAAGLLDVGYNVYYTVTEYTASIHLKSIDIVSLTESELEEYNNYISEDLNIESILALGEMSDIVSEYPLTVNKITEFFDKYSDDTEIIRNFLEVSSYCIDHDMIEEAFDNLSNIRDDFNDLLITYEYDIRSYYPLTKTSLDVKLEAYYGLIDVLYEDVKPVDNKKKNIDSDKKKEPVKKENINDDRIGGVNFANVKLVLAGLKKKVKDLGSKEKEMSRNIDTTFNMFVKSCKNALISDRREAIIKGSVIPSFSKCLKLVVAFAGLAYVNVGAAVIAAIGAFAASKRLTQKERLLLLDDIEIEIEMLDKEISLAESQNKMKKLRVLMRTKKDLQRQYQRIKYGIRVGKDILPSSNLRTPGGER